MPLCYGIDEYGSTAKKANRITYQTVKIKEPATIEDALNGSHSEEWKLAADLEYSSLIENETWELVKLPEECKLLAVNVFFKWSIMVKAEFNASRVSSLHKVFYKSVALTMMKFFLLLLICPQSALY